MTYSYPNTNKDVALVDDKPLQIVTAVHNEELIIEQVLSDLFNAFKNNNISAEFIVCEDGSTDDTVRVIKDLQSRLPIKLITSTQRKGYSRGVLDGLKDAQADHVAYVDSDGQYFPEDLVKLYQNRNKADAIIGWRNPRADPLHRILMSKAYKTIYKPLTGVTLKDPSCSCLVIKQASLRRILDGYTNYLDQGFWWEFYAYALNRGVAWQEMPVRHRQRLAGQSDIYRLQKIPGIAIRHVKNLFKLKAALKR